MNNGRDIKRAGGRQDTEREIKEGKEMEGGRGGGGTPRRACFNYGAIEEEVDREVEWGGGTGESVAIRSPIWKNA